MGTISVALCTVSCITLRAILPDQRTRQRPRFWAMAAALVVPSASLAAQPASLVYRLGRDTVAVEQFTRNTVGLTGEMVQRNGAVVARYSYQVALGRDGRPTAATVARLQPDGTPVSTGVRETRFTITADSIVREAVFADSTQRRAFAAKGALVNFPVFVYGPTELLAVLRARKLPTDSLPALGLTGPLGMTGFTASGDTLRLRGGAYAMVLRYDASGRLQGVDGSGTTNKVLATRGPGGLDMNAIARSMTPTGTLSGREDARAAFGPGGFVIVDYGRPSVRERTVWGGTLVPYDSVWRAGANDATHLITTRTLTMGDLTLAPGMYSLWIQHTRSGTFLIVNSQIGQWGTQYDATKYLGRVPMTFTTVAAPVEVLTMTVRSLAANRGQLDIAWGTGLASLTFGVGAR
ncbi:MAG: DUF2911 domain-containing protein [Gemmatimonadetes bacterium]|nr:DUF2911 domain-containing protein [Gemmatimonadota bacterium]